MFCHASDTRHSTHYTTTYCRQCSECSQERTTTANVGVSPPSPAALPLAVADEHVVVGGGLLQVKDTHTLLLLGGILQLLPGIKELLQAEASRVQQDEHEREMRTDNLSRLQS